MMLTFVSAEKKLTFFVSMLFVLATLALFIASLFSNKEIPFTVVSSTLIYKNVLF